MSKNRQQTPEPRASELSTSLFLSSPETKKKEKSMAACARGLEKPDLEVVSTTPPHSTGQNSATCHQVLLS